MKTNLNRVISLTSILFLNTAYGVNFSNQEITENINAYATLEAKFLYWRLEDSPTIIELVRSGTIAAPATELVMGGERIHNPWRAGGKFGLIYWPKQYCGYGIQANYFFLPSKSTEQSVESSGALDSALLSIPYFDVNLQREALTNVSFPGPVLPYSGEATLKIANKMQGAELNALSPTKMWRNIPYNYLVGLRYWQFDDKLLFATNSPFVDGSDVFQTEDAFKAKNKFLGLQLGSGAHYQLANAFFKAKGTVALGAMYSELDVDGSLRTTNFNAIRWIQEFPGGYFALPSNMGKQHRWRVAAIPELNFKFGYNVDESLSWFIDYSFLYVTEVAWSTSQLDRNINPTQSAAITVPVAPALVGSRQPEANINSNSLWIQGIALGFIYKL